MDGMKRILTGVIATALAVAAISGPVYAAAPGPAGGAGQPITLKLGSFNGEASPSGRGVDDCSTIAAGSS